MESGCIEQSFPKHPSKAPMLLPMLDVAMLHFLSLAFEKRSWDRKPQDTQKEYAGIAYNNQIDQVCIDQGIVECDAMEIRSSSSLSVRSAANAKDVL